MTCVRLRELCDKLYHPKNSLCRQRMHKWYMDSLLWAEKLIGWGRNESIYVLRMRYILNHMCSSLVHLLPKPHFNYYVSEVYNLNAVMYEFENSTLRVIGCNNEVISHGVEHTLEEWEFLVCAIFPLVASETNVRIEDYFRCIGISFPLNPKLSAVLDEYTEKFMEVEF